MSKQRTMWKATAWGVYPKQVTKVLAKVLFFKIKDGRIKKEQIHTMRHSWHTNEKDANTASKLFERGLL